MAKASRKKRSAVKRRSNPSTGTIFALVALGAVAAGGAWWFFSKKTKAVIKPTELIRSGASRVSPMAAMTSLRPGAGALVRTGEAAASEAPAKAPEGAAAPGAAPGVGGLPGIGPSVAP